MELKTGELKVFYAGGINQGIDSAIEDALGLFGMKRWASGQDLVTGTRDLAFQCKIPESGETGTPVHWQSHSNIWRSFSELARDILVGGAYKVTKYLNDTLTIKATRKRYKEKILRGHAIDIVFTVGKPNYEEREVIKQHKKAGMNVTNKISEKFLK